MIKILKVLNAQPASIIGFFDLGRVLYLLCATLLELRRRSASSMRWRISRSTFSLNSVSIVAFHYPVEHISWSVDFFHVSGELCTCLSV
jgi:hypothetical protein